MAVKISGFTIIRNAVVNDYPIIEAVSSILPVVDEMIISVGDNQDSTMELIKTLNSPKIKIITSTWDPNLRHGGRVLAVETDKAFHAISHEADWAFYIQADEVVHEKYHQAIREAAEQYKNDSAVEGLVFKYLHFYGTFDYVGDSRKWYHREIRIIRNDKSINSYLDAQGFRKGKKRLNCKLIDAYVYHYGWVKNPELMKKKLDHISQYWNEDTDEWRNKLQQKDFFNFDEFDSIARFTDAHPKVMEARIKRLNWKLDLDTSKKNFSFIYRLLYLYEKLTGVRPFGFRNYELLK